MMNLPIQQLPNQAFTVILDDNSWEFLIKTVEQATVMSLTLNNQPVIDSVIAVAGSLIIPSRYEEAGNFFFVTQNQALPYYTDFNVSQQLIYISAAELAALRLPPPVPIPASYFDPLGALPLRFAPQGYT